MTALAAPELIDGVPVGRVVRPTSYDEVAAALREAAARGETVAARGGGSKLSWGAPPRSVDLLVDTTGLDAVLEHNPGDLVIRAQAGVRLAGLQDRVGGAGQRLALDPPEPGATLGGIVATGASGPARLRYGTVRDLLIGVTVVLADGTTATAGGKVVKNVAGYDLGKVYTGSLGTLGVIVETVWRLHPLPAATRVVTVPDLAPEVLGRLVQSVLHSHLVPTAVELDRPSGAPATLTVLLEGTVEAVEAQAATAAELAAGVGATASTADGTAEEHGRHPSGEVLLKLAFEPAALEAVLSALPDEAHVRGHAATGVLFAAVPASAAGSVEALRATVAPYDGSVVVADAPPAVKSGLDVWGPVGDALPLMRRVKDRFDPEHRLAPGRFVGGI